jgi:hypothetical protein
VGTVFLLIVGSFLGVFADRIWRKYVESRVRLNIVPQQLVVPQGVGVIFKITNCGSLSLPPFRLSINHPKQGSIFPFSNNAKNALMPGQSVTENFVFGISLVSPHDIEFFFREDAGEEDFSLIVKQWESDRVLFESKKIGNAFARIWRQTSGGRDFENVKSEDWKNLSHIYIPLWKRLLRIKDHKPKQGNTVCFSLPVKNGEIMMTDKMHVKIIK